jgi:hypothetical protein
MLPRQKNFIMNPIKAIIKSISEEVKTKSNKKQFLVCTVEFTEGKFAGKTFFAQRTLGENKSAISVGQSVNCMPTIVKAEDGTERPFFEISTGTTVTDANEILALLKG